MTTDHFTAAVEHARRVQATRIVLPPAPTATGDPATDRAAMLGWLAANRAAGVQLMGCPAAPSTLTKEEKH